MCEPMDLNVDLGEGFGRWVLNCDQAYSTS